MLMADYRHCRRRTSPIDPLLRRHWEQAPYNPKNAWDRRRREHLSAQRRRKRRPGNGARKKRRRLRRRAHKLTLATNDAVVGVLAEPNPAPLELEPQATHGQHMQQQSSPPISAVSAAMGSNPSPCMFDCARPPAPGKAQRPAVDASSIQTSATSRYHELMCVACWENPRDTALLPCRHLCYCSGCANATEQSSCPICREPVEEVLSFIFS